MAEAFTREGASGNLSIETLGHRTGPHYPQTHHSWDPGRKIFVISFEAIPGDHNCKDLPVLVLSINMLFNTNMMAIKWPLIVFIAITCHQMANELQSIAITCN